MDDLEKIEQQLSKVCTPCLGYQIKKTLVNELGDSVAETVKKIPTCDDQLAINLCENTPGGRSTKSKKGRRLSAYQLFVSKCMKDKHLKGFDPGAMKDCAAQWREEKERNAKR